MARVMFSALMTGIKGRIGGTVFQGGTGGYIVKTIDPIAASAKLTKADAGKVYNPQGTIAYLSSRWRLLSNAQRATWQSGAVNYPQTTPFGITYTPSGYAVFMMLNAQYYPIAGLILEVCPLPISLPELPAVEIVQASLTSITVDFGSYSEVDTTVRIEATQRMSLGIQPKNSFFKIIKQASGSSTWPLQVYADYEQVYGPIQAGGRIWMRFQVISNETGQKGITQTAFFNVT